MNDRANQIIPALVFEYGVFAVSVHLVTNRVVQPAIAILAIKNVNATMVGHSSVDRLSMKPVYLQMEMWFERVATTFAYKTELMCDSCPYMSLGSQHSEMILKRLLPIV